MIVSLLCYKNKINQFFYRNPNNTAAVDYQRRVSCTVPRLDGVALFFFCNFCTFHVWFFFSRRDRDGWLLLTVVFLAWKHVGRFVLVWAQTGTTRDLACTGNTAFESGFSWFFFSCQNPFSHFFCCLSFVHSTSPRSTVPRPYTQTSFPLQQH